MEVPTQTDQGGMDPSHEDDLAMVRGTLEGDRGDLEQFMTRIQSVRRFIAYKNAQYGSPLGPTDLEDTVQETLLAIWRKLPEYEGRGSFETWVYRFCFLELMTRIRKKHRRKSMFEVAPEDGDDALRSPPKVDALEFEHIYRSLDELDPKTADVIRAKHIEQRTFEEIGTRSGVSVNTVKTRYYRGMRKLRELLSNDPSAGEDQP